MKVTAKLRNNDCVLYLCMLCSLPISGPTLRTLFHVNYDNVGFFSDRDQIHSPIGSWKNLLPGVCDEKLGLRVKTLAR